MAGFDALGLSASVMKGIEEMGFKEPTPIQAQALPLLFQGEDVIGQAKTGTGKTAAFGIYALEGLDYSLAKPQVLILTPTRELCLQVRNEIAALGKHTGARIAAVYGGQEIEKQLRFFEGGAQIVVGTPGRIVDHLKRGSLAFGDVGLVVIDEADRMLDMGFIEDVGFILANTPEDRQTLLFSATIPQEIMELAERYMNEPQLVKVGEDETPVITHIEQSFITIHDPRDRLHALLRYLQEERPQLAIVFCRTKLGAEKLCHILHERGFRAECLHGDLPQKKRELVMKRFRERRFNILVATDLAARGLHVDGITHVINYNIPDDHLDYVHRVGRTGRMGKAGGAVTLVLKDEMGKLGEIERALSLRMKEIRYELKRRGGRIPQGSSNAIAAGGVGRRWRGAPAPPTYNL